MRLRDFAILVMLVLPGSLFAQACDAPHPFDRTASFKGHVKFAPGAGSTCDLVATLDADNATSSGAFAWYSLPKPVERWRISFRVDPTASTGASPVSAVAILSATSRQPWPQSGGQAALLYAVLQGLDDPVKPLLSVALACGAPSCANPQHIWVATFPEYIAMGDVLRFELTTGAGDAGRLRWWLNADFADPPTEEIGGLDNAAWRGVQRVALGAFNAVGDASANGASLHYWDINSPDDVIFWSDFDE